MAGRRTALPELRLALRRSFYTAGQNAVCPWKIPEILIYFYLYMKEVTFLMDTDKQWRDLDLIVKHCQDCPLHQKRTHAVPGEGNQNATLMFIGEGPGRDEDRQGRPFVGKAGQLLDKMIAAIDLTREDIYIANIVKCRPPQNRVPTAEEAEACLKYLRRQVYLIQPKIIVLLGSTALRFTVDRDARITRMRGTWIESKGVFMMPTYHPAALLRDPAKKYEVWEDLQKVQTKLKELTDQSA